MSPYITKTAAQLIEIYCFEHGRTNQEDKAITQAKVKKELQKRFDAMLLLMDDPTCAEHPEQIYEYFTKEYSPR